MNKILKIILDITIMAMIFFFSFYYLAPLTISKYHVMTKEKIVNNVMMENIYQLESIKNNQDENTPKIKRKIESNKKRISKCYDLLISLNNFESRDESFKNIRRLKRLISRIQEEASLIEGEIKNIKQGKQAAYPR